VCGRALSEPLPLPLSPPSTTAITNKQKKHD
jgi:hypothetical protein